MNTKDFKMVNIIDYAKEMIEKNGMTNALKKACIKARKGNVGDIVYSITGDHEFETRNIVGEKREHCPDWIATSIDKTGKETKNRWIIEDDYFNKNYVHVENDVYLAIPIEKNFVKVADDISFIAPWGEEFLLRKDGFLNVTDMSNIYGIQKEDFIRSYEIVK